MFNRLNTSHISGHVRKYFDQKIKQDFSNPKLAQLLDLKQKLMSSDAIIS